jgi:hypothetical protein
MTIVDDVMARLPTVDGVTRDGLIATTLETGRREGADAALRLLRERVERLPHLTLSSGRVVVARDHVLALLADEEARDG